MKKTNIGVDENIAGLLCYVFGWISGLVIILLEKENSFVRFHAMQSIVTFGALTILSVFLSAFPLFGMPLLNLVQMAVIALWVILIIKAYQGKQFKLPVIGDLAEEWSRKF